MKKDIGIYIHIPFCKQKCYYCDFVSYSNKEGFIDGYVQALLKEIEYRELHKYNISTIYIGGGTPSLLDSKYIRKVLCKIKGFIGENVEITIEVNPGTASKEKLLDYRKAGINRISLGLQSTNNTILQYIGRIHTYQEFLDIYDIARNVGFSNINVDLMLGLPNQNLSILEASINKVIELKPEHISIYSLILEENTKIFNMIKEKKLVLPNEEIEREMYWKSKRILEENGYIHYEISNFAKINYMSKHNTDCWEQKEYIGFGSAAHSYLDGVRFSNIIDIEKYINNINNNKFEQNIIIHEKQTEEEKQKEYMLLGLRKIEGINILKFKDNFNQNPLELYKDEIQKLIKDKLIKVNKNYIKLTNKGLDFANIVWQEFV